MFFEMRVSIIDFDNLTSPNASFARSEARRVGALLHKDYDRRYKLVDPGDNADLILFVCLDPEMAFAALNSHQWKSNPEKCFVYCPVDRPLPLMPGIYPSLERKLYSDVWTRSGAYVRVAFNENITHMGSIKDCKHLFFFRGAIENHPVRRKLLQIRSCKGVIEDTSILPRKERQADGMTRGNAEYIDRYRSLLQDSKFALCPRGIGSSSWRIFETLKAGRIPVIISDDWVAPLGPDWNSFSVFVPENQVDSIPKILEGIEDRAEEMALASQHAWTNWFSDTRLFHTIVESCHDIQRSRDNSKIVRPSKYIRHCFSPFFLRHWLIPEWRRRVFRFGRRELLSSALS